MTTYTSRGVPMAQNSDLANIADRVNPVAQKVHERPGISPLTTSQRNALAGADLWDGRVIANTTTDKLERYDLGATTWRVVADTADVNAILSSTAPSPVGPAANAGAATTASRSDHTHAIPYGAFNPSQLAATSDPGSSNGVSRADHRHATPFGGTPPAVAAAGSAGASTNLSRSDHTHAIPYGAAPPAAGAASSAGAATTVSRSDHTHAVTLATTTPAPVAAAGAVGVGTTPARSDHTHAIPYGAAPPAAGAASSAGAATTVSRSDHTHAIPNLSTAQVAHTLAAGLSAVPLTPSGPNANWVMRRPGIAIMSISAISSTTFAAGDTLFTLPGGFVPAAPVGLGVDVAGSSLVRLVVNVGGTVKMMSLSTTVVSGNYLSGTFVIPLAP